MISQGRSKQMAHHAMKGQRAKKKRERENTKMRKMKEEIDLLTITNKELRLLHQKQGKEICALLCYICQLPKSIHRVSF